MIRSIEPESRYRRSDSILARDIGDEVFIIKTQDSGAAEEDAGIVLDGVARAIWLLLDGSHTVQQVIDQIAMEFDAPEAQITVDVLAFFDQLANEGLISE